MSTSQTSWSPCARRHTSMNFLRCLGGDSSQDLVVHANRDLLERLRWVPGPRRRATSARCPAGGTLPEAAELTVPTSATAGPGSEGRHDQPADLTRYEIAPHPTIQLGQLPKTFAKSTTLVVCSSTRTASPVMCSRRRFPGRSCCASMERSKVMTLLAAFIAAHPVAERNLRRWFFDAPLQDSGKTWVLSKMWGLDPDCPQGLGRARTSTPATHGAERRTVGVGRLEHRTKECLAPDMTARIVVCVDIAHSRGRSVATSHLACRRTATCLRGVGSLLRHGHCQLGGRLPDCFVAAKSDPGLDPGRRATPSAVKMLSGNPAGPRPRPPTGPPGDDEVVCLGRLSTVEAGGSAPCLAALGLEAGRQ